MPGDLRAGAPRALANGKLFLAQVYGYLACLRHVGGCLSVQGFPIAENGRFDSGLRGRAVLFLFNALSDGIQTVLIQHGQAVGQTLGFARIIMYLQGNIAPNGGQMLGKATLFGVVAHLFAQLALDFIGVSQHVFQRVVAGQQLHGRLFTHAWNAWNIVRAVAHQALEIGNLIRPHAEQLLHAGGRAFLYFGDALAGQQQGGIVADQLQRVAVACQQQGGDIPLGALAGQGAQDVVGLIARQAQHAQPHGGEDFLDNVKLRAQLVRRGRTASLVLRVFGMAEGRRMLVKRHRAVAGRAFADAAQQHAQKAVHGVGIHAVVVHQRQGMKGPVHQAVAIHNQKSIAHCIHLHSYYNTFPANIQREAAPYYMQEGQYAAFSG